MTPYQIVFDEDPNGQTRRCVVYVRPGCYVIATVDTRANQWSVRTRRGHFCASGLGESALKEVADWAASYKYNFKTLESARAALKPPDLDEPW